MKANLYKHQALFDELSLDDCPSSELEELDIRAYRWTHSPITHSWNFLPNILYDRARKKPSRVLEKKDLCKNSNLSFFTSESIAKNKLNYFKERLEKKHKKMIDFYTHIAGGQISKTDGRATAIKDYHFGFFEYNDSELQVKFIIISEI